MKIILLKDVAKVGRKYDVKDVSDGYASNMLIPRGLAKVATPDAIKKIEELKSNDLTAKKIQEELLLKNLEVIKNLIITLKGKVNDKGHLFAGITKEMIANELEKETKFKLDPESIKLSKPIKEVGEHLVKIEIGGKSAEFKFEVSAL